MTHALMTDLGQAHALDCADDHPFWDCPDFAPIDETLDPFVAEAKASNGFATCPECGSGEISFVAADPTLTGTTMHHVECLNDGCDWYFDHIAQEN